MKQQKPVFLDLTKIRFPITAIASILHRISGLIIFLLIPLLLWLAHSASTASGFAEIQNCLTSPVCEFFVWVVLAALIFHLIAGIRHLLMDIHLGETLSAAKTSATTVIVLAVILIIVAGVWIW